MSSFLIVLLGSALPVISVAYLYPEIGHTVSYYHLFPPINGNKNTEIIIFNKLWQFVGAVPSILLGVYSLTLYSSVCERIVGAILLISRPFLMRFLSCFE